MESPPWGTRAEAESVAPPNKAHQPVAEAYSQLSGERIEEIKGGLRTRTLNGEVVPALCGSAFKNKGVQAMLDAYLRARNNHSEAYHRSSTAR